MRCESARRVSTSRSRPPRTRLTGSWPRRSLAMLSLPMGRRASRPSLRNVSPSGGILKGFFLGRSRLRGEGERLSRFSPVLSWAGRLLQDYFASPQPALRADLSGERGGELSGRPPPVAAGLLCFTPPGASPQV